MFQVFVNRSLHANGNTKGSGRFEKLLSSLLVGHRILRTILLLVGFLMFLQYLLFGGERFEASQLVESRSKVCPIS